MFRYLITLQPLGFLYGSAGAFLSPENLVGRSGAKFPPDAATVSGLFLSSSKADSSISHETLAEKLYTAGPFWAKVDSPEYFYVPLPRHQIITKGEADELVISSYQWCLQSEIEQKEAKKEIKSDEIEYNWLKIDYWDRKPREIKQHLNDNSPSAATKCWEYVPMLHPHLKQQERHTLPEDGLFLENAVQMREDACLVYLSTHPLKDGWYQFGGENHIVEVKSFELPDDSPIIELLEKPIQRAFALISPGLWGSNNLSYRYPHASNFAFDNNKIKLLTDKAIPYRYRIGYGEKKKEDFQQRTQGRLSRGRYAVPSGSVYVLKEPLNMNWWDFPKEWFPEKGLLKKIGCGLCLPVTIQGVED